MSRFHGVELDEFVVMPNHLHGIVILVGAGLALPHPAASGPSTEALGAGCASAGRASPAPTLGTVVGAFKSRSAIACNRLLGRSGRTFWQRSYYEHVIRNELSLDRIRQYIIENPARWEYDRENPMGKPDMTETAFWDRLQTGPAPKQPPKASD